MEGCENPQSMFFSTLISTIRGCNKKNVNGGFDMGKTSINIIFVSRLRGSNGRIRKINELYLSKVRLDYRSFFLCVFSCSLQFVALISAPHRHQNGSLITMKIHKYIYIYTYT